MQTANRIDAALLVAASLALASACGGGGKTDQNPGVLDCAWLHGQNCWKAVVSAVAACAPTSEGIFSADRRTCSFASGEQVVFATPFTMSDPLYNFSMGTCITLVQPDAHSLRLTSRAGTVSARGDPQAKTLEVTCPNGASYVADFGPQSPLLSCDRAEQLLPDVGCLIEGPEDSTKVYLRGADTDSNSVTVWSCH